MKNTSIEIHELVWDGITIRITYQPNSYSVDGLAHCEVQSIVPDMMPLPITETGYRSHHFFPTEDDKKKGIVPLVRDWLDAEAKRVDWKAKRVMAAQSSLF